jgi:hypothetical protein
MPWSKLLLVKTWFVIFLINRVVQLVPSCLILQEHYYIVSEVSDVWKNSLYFQQEVTDCLLVVIAEIVNDTISKLIYRFIVEIVLH